MPPRPATHIQFSLRGLLLATLFCSIFFALLKFLGFSLLDIPVAFILSFTGALIALGLVCAVGVPFPRQRRF